MDGRWKRSTSAAEAVDKLRVSTAWAASMLAAVLAALVVWCVAAECVRAASATAADAPTGRVAFIRDGGLWVQELPAGQPVRVWRGLLSHPRWSPSGKWLMVDEGERVRIIPLGRQRPSRSLQGQGAAWSPREDLLAYQDPSGNLVVSDPLEEQTRVVVGVGLPGTASFPVWSPDGRWLAFQAPAGTAGRPGEPGPTIWKVDLEGGRPIQVLGYSGEARVCLKLAGWSPKSDDILYWPVDGCSSSILADGVSLMAVPAHGGEPRQLEETMLTYPDFLADSPAANLLAVTAGVGRMTWHDKSIEVLNLTAGTAVPISPPGYAATSPAWSPDGRQVAFAAMPDAGPQTGGGESARTALMQRRIWAASLDDGTTRQLTPDAAYRDEAPHWIRSGILFARLDEYSAATLWLLDPAEGAIRQVASIDAPRDAWFGYYGWLDWSAVSAVHEG